MWTRIRRFFAAPVFEDEERTRVAQLLNAVLWAFLAATLLIGLSAAALYAIEVTPESLFTLLSGVVMTTVTVGLLILARRGRLRLAGSVLLALSWGVITLWIFTVAGISTDTSSLTYVLLIVLAGLLLGGRAAMAFTAASALSVLGAYYAEISGLLVVVESPLSLSDPLFIVVPLILTGALLHYAVRSMDQALKRARDNERAQIEANRELETLRASLEQRVAGRTRDLERRSVQMQAAAEVGRAATSILDTAQLIWRVAELIWERFGLYHVGLFLLDETGSWAVYRAGAGEAGRELFEQGFRLPVGGVSMVGWCTANAQARVAQDVSTEAVHTDHDLVPRTRSEAALPLIAREQVIGALSVQSDQPDTFDPDTVAALQTMADQVAVALDNARLFSESQEALEAMRRAYGESTRRAWSELLRGHADWGYSYSHGTVAPAGGDWQPEMLQALETGRVVQREYADEASRADEADEASGASEADRTSVSVDEQALAIPLQVRGETVGVLSFYKDPEGGPELASGAVGWTPEEMGLLARLVHQLGLALESAQFYEETQRRAAREEAIRHITDRMRRAVEVETILQSTVAELARTLGVPRAYVRLGTEAELLGSRTAGPASDRGVAFERGEENVEGN